MYKEIDHNKKTTRVLISVFVVLMLAISYLIGESLGDFSTTVMIFVGALIYAFVQYFLASKLALMMAGARQIELRDDPRFYRIVENLSITTGLPMPKVYIIDDPSPNAFATGRDPNHSAVAATSGLIEMMNDRELEAVMAHEMAHVGNYDIKVSMMVFGLVAAIGLLSDIGMRLAFKVDSDDDRASAVMLLIGLVAAILGPVIALFVQMAISRNREYLADATAALTTRDPESLASALEKLSHDKTRLRNQSSSMANMYINNPLQKGFVAKLTSTHPPIEDRIAKLRTMAGQF